MFNDILKEFDKIANRALVESAQPISDKVEYEAGRRIGVVQGIARARQMFLDLNTKDNDKDKDL